MKRLLLVLLLGFYVAIVGMGSGPSFGGAASASGAAGGPTILNETVDISADFIGPTQTGWTDVDMSAYVPAGTTAVLIRGGGAVFGVAPVVSLQVRRNGDTGGGSEVETFGSADQNNVRGNFWVPVDASLIFEAKMSATLSSASFWDWHLAGYSS